MDLDRPNIEEYLTTDTIHKPPHEKLRLRDLLDISPTLTEAAGAIIDDSFTRCFKSNSPEPWNWNIYLFPLWCFGVLIRYGILFPIRVLVLTIGWIIFLSSFIPVNYLLKGRNDKLRRKLESFTMHLLRLMTSWAVVCDVWYLEPQTLKPGETAIEFAERVREIISVRAGLRMVPWDGYLKYSRPSPKHTEQKQQIFAESVLRRLEEK